MTGCGDREKRRDAIFAEQIDRLNRGEGIDREGLRARHADIAQEVISRLEAFEDLGAGSAPPLLPERLGKYRIVRELGRGGMGVVYEAVEEELDRRVALKVLPPGFIAEEKALARFRREARVAAQLRHPNIVPVYSLGAVEAGTPYIAMELVAGESLESLLERKSPGGALDSRQFRTGALAGPDKVRAVEAAAETADVAAPGGGVAAARDSEVLASGAPSSTVDLAYCLQMARAFADVAGALEEAHSKGIVHRDLKPSNLILDGEGRLRILDFGIARLEGQERLTQAGEVFGTPRYMSPEQARGEQDAVDPRADIYSLGATLYEALALTPIFQARTPAAVLGQVLHDEPRPLRSLQPRVPVDLATIVHKCLAKRPEDRYRSAAALALDLRRCAQGDAIEARPPGLGERLLRRLRRHWGKAAVACVVAILAITLLARSHLAQRAAARAAYPNQIMHALSTLYVNGALFRQLGEFAWSGSGYDPWRISKGLEGIEEGPIREALELLEAARDAVPDRPDADYQLARAHWLLLRPEKAHEALEAAAGRGFAEARTLSLTLRGEPGGATSGWSGTWARAQRAARDGEWQAAAAAYEELRRLLPAGEEPFIGAALDAHLGAGIAHLHLLQTDEARQCFQRAAGAWPQAIEIEVLIGVSHLVEGGASRRVAERIFEELYRRRPDTNVAGLLAMLYAVAQERYDLGIVWAERSPPGYLRELWRTICLLGLGLVDAAAEAAASLVRLGPDVALSHFLAANIGVATGDLTGAAAAARRATELAPDAGGTHALLSNVARLQGRPREAREHLERAVQVEPGFAQGHYYLGLSLLAPATAAQAEASLRRAIELSRGVKGAPLGTGEPHLALATSCFLQGNTGAAGEAMREAVRRGNWSAALDPQWLPVLVKAHEIAGEPRRLLVELERLLHFAAGDGRRTHAIAELLDARYGQAAPDLPTCRAIDRALAAAGQETVVPAGAVWAFHRGVAPPSPALEWTAAGFDDAAWERGPAGFGYGDDDDATRLDDMRDSYTSVYLRGAFEVSDPERCEAIELEVLADDGCIAYLNGREALRVRAPDGTPGHDAVATADASEPILPAIVRLPARDALIAGRNLVAVQGLNVSARSSDFSLLPVVRLLRRDATAAQQAAGDACRRVLADGAASGRLAYLEGRLLELEGRAGEALPRLAAACDAEPAAWEPLAALVRASRAASQPREAEPRLRAFLEATCPGREAWVAWASLVLGDLRLSPSQALEALPGCSDAHHGALRSLLAALAGQSPLQLSLGTGRGRSPGIPWGLLGAPDADGLECAVPLPPGRYRVELEAPPPGLIVEGREVHATAIEVEVTDGCLEMRAGGDGLEAVRSVRIVRS